jgi:hypothetical protein
MFDLRKDLRIYTSKSASGLRAALDAGVRDGNKLVFSSIAKLQQHGRSIELEYQAVGTASAAALDLLLERYRQPTTIEFLLMRPEVCINDLKRGVATKLEFDLEAVERDSQAESPAGVMSKLALSRDSRLAAALGMLDRGYRRRTDKATHVMRVWALYGMELQSSAKRDQLDKALQGLPLSDLGLTTVEDMAGVVHLLRHVSSDYAPAVVLAAVQQLDKLLAAAGAPPIQRSKPRMDTLKLVAGALQGESLPDEHAPDEHEQNQITRMIAYLTSDDLVKTITRGY